MTPIDRRTALRLGIPAAFAAVGVRPAAAEPLDGKGNDVCPCFFDVDTAVLEGEETIRVSGPCAVANPPEEVTVRVQVRGDRGARALGRETFECHASESQGESGTFSVAAAIRGPNRFEPGDEISVHAKVQLNPDGKPTVSGRWSWTGTLE
ncbi:MAG: hypothetical protein R3324_16470 [Halobacteriales archaeon]|nr:hypothetical protein [Halobacteriales archaeon]